MMIYQSFSMLITMMMTLNILLVDGNTYLIIHGNNQTDWSRIRFPYKSVYDLPNTLHCQQSVINNFHQCEIEHHEKWEVSIDSYFYETREFCCFVWQTMDCEIEQAKRCNKDYSEKIETNTKETFTKVCNKVGTGHKSNWCFWDKKTKMIAGIIFGVVLFLIAVAVAAGCGYKYFKKYQDKKIQNMEKSWNIQMENFKKKIAVENRAYFDANFPDSKLQRTTSLPTGSTSPQVKALARSKSLPLHMDPNMQTPDIPDKELFFGRANVTDTSSMIVPATTPTTTATVQRGGSLPARLDPNMPTPDIPKRELFPIRANLTHSQSANVPGTTTRPGLLQRADSMPINAPIKAPIFKQAPPPTSSIAASASSSLSGSLSGAPAQAPAAAPASSIASSSSSLSGAPAAVPVVTQAQVHISADEIARIQNLMDIDRTF